MSHKRRVRGRRRHIPRLVWLALAIPGVFCLRQLLPVWRMANSAVPVPAFGRAAHNTIAEPVVSAAIRPRARAKGRILSTFEVPAKGVGTADVVQDMAEPMIPADSATADSATAEPGDGEPAGAEGAPTEAFPLPMLAYDIFASPIRKSAAGGSAWNPGISAGMRGDMPSGHMPAAGGPYGNATSGDGRPGSLPYEAPPEQALLPTYALARVEEMNLSKSATGVWPVEYPARPLPPWGAAPGWVAGTRPPAPHRTPPTSSPSGTSSGTTSLAGIPVSGIAPGPPPAMTSDVPLTAAEDVFSAPEPPPELPPEPPPGPPDTPVEIPEPASWALLGCGALFLAVFLGYRRFGIRSREKMLL